MLMRHAKSDWDADFESDHDRPLNERGYHSARLMGRVLAGRALAPNLVVSSTAVRARTTAELAVEAGEWDCPLRLDRGLYESGPAGVLATASTAPDVPSLMLVGHQPTWSLLVREMTGETVDMKTATVAVVEIAIDSWSVLTDAEGHLVEVLFPGDFAGSEWDRD